MLIRQAAHIIVYGPRDPEKPVPPLPVDIPADFEEDPADDDDEEEDEDEDAA